MHLRDRLIFAAVYVVSIFLIPFLASAKIEIENLNLDKVYGDFVIGPGKNEITLEPGTSKTINLLVSNRMGVTRDFNLETEDFSGSIDPEQPIVLLGNERGPYSLKDYIVFTDKKFTLKHGERALVPITISVPSDASPGGLYGSVLVSTVSSPGAEKSSGYAPIISRLGSLFFVTVPGEVKKEGKLVEFGTKNRKVIFTKGPVNFDILFENKGNIYLNPHGAIKISNTIGDEVGLLEVKPWFALPNSLRLREISWDKPFLFGRYTASLTLNRGIDEISDSSTVSFYVFPIRIIFMTFAGIFILAFLIYFIFSRFEIKRK